MINKMPVIFSGILFFLFKTITCSEALPNNKSESNTNLDKPPMCISEYDSTIKTIHIYVALCDNTYQGIVPVPTKIGNGQDVDNNLYWGTQYGIRTYFKKSPQWKLIKTESPGNTILQRLVFKHTQKNHYLVADAYNGKFIKECTVDFLNSACGQKKDAILVHDKRIGIQGNAKLLAYIGHDGLMDFSLAQNFDNADGLKRDIIILACYSKQFFKPHLIKANIRPILWTTNLMCPEAYTVHDAIGAYINNEPEQQVRQKAAAAYSKYQKCSIKAASGLLVGGW